MNEKNQYGEDGQIAPPPRENNPNPPPPQDNMNQPPQQNPPPPPPGQQQGGHIPERKSKSNKTMIIAVVAVAAVVILIAAFFLMMGNRGLVGEWEYSESVTSYGVTVDVSMTVEFNKDGTGTMDMDSSYYSGNTVDFTWEASNGELTIDPEGGTTSTVDYEIKDNGNTLVMTMPFSVSGSYGEVEFERVG